MEPAPKCRAVRYPYRKGYSNIYTAKWAASQKQKLFHSCLMTQGALLHLTFPLLVVSLKRFSTLHTTDVPSRKNKPFQFRLNINIIIYRQLNLSFYNMQY